MTHEEFISKWVGWRVKEYWMSTYECVALAKQYIKEVLWQPVRWFWWSAWAAYNNVAHTFDDNWVQGKGEVQKWDIIFSPPTPYNKYGHVAVAHSTTEMIEQNGWIGKGTGTAKDAIRITPIRTEHYYWRLKTNMQEPRQESEIMKVHERENPPHLFSDYTDTTLLQWREVRALIDLAFHRK